MPKVQNIISNGDQAVVELKASGKTKNGAEVGMDAAFFCEFEGEMIIKVRVYMDSALMKRILEENE